MNEPAPERNQSASLRRALAVLEHVRDHAGGGQGLSLTRLAEALGLSKSTVLRLTAPLVEARLLDRDRKSGAYRLGHGALRLGQSYLATLDLRTVAAEESHRLMTEVRETVHLVVYDPPDVVYIDKVENETNVRMASRIGSRAPVYCTAVGKAILAWQPEEDVERVVAAGMPQITRHTITGPDRSAPSWAGSGSGATRSTTARTNPRCAASPHRSSTTPTPRPRPSPSPASPRGSPPRGSAIWGRWWRRRRCASPGSWDRPVEKAEIDPLTGTDEPLRTNF